MSPTIRKFKTKMLAKLRECLADDKPRPATLTARYAATVAKLERELS